LKKFSIFEYFSVISQWKAEKNTSSQGDRSSVSLLADLAGYLSLSERNDALAGLFDVSLSSDRAWSGRRSAQLHWYGEPLQTS
jgi:hypothetical protein